MFKPTADQETTTSTIPPNASGSQRQPGKLGSRLSMFEALPLQTQETPVTGAGRGRETRNGEKVSSIRNSMRLVPIPGGGMKLVNSAPAEETAEEDPDSLISSSTVAESTATALTQSMPNDLIHDSELYATVSLPSSFNQIPSAHPTSPDSLETDSLSQSDTSQAVDTTLHGPEHTTSPHDVYSSSSSSLPQISSHQTNSLDPTHSVKFSEIDLGPTPEAREQEIFSQFLTAITRAYQFYSEHVRDKTLNLRYIDDILVEEQYFGLFHAFMHDENGITRADVYCVKVIERTNKFNESVSYLSEFLNASDVSYGPYSFTAYLFDQLIELCRGHKHVNLSKQEQYSPEFTKFLTNSLQNWAQAKRDEIPNASAMLSSNQMPTGTISHSSQSPTNMDVLASMTMANPASPSTDTSTVTRINQPSHSPHASSVSLYSSLKPTGERHGESQTSRPMPSSAATPKPSGPPPQRPAPRPPSMLSPTGVGTNSNLLLPAPAGSTKKGPAPTPPLKPKALLPSRPPVPSA